MSVAVKFYDLMNRSIHIGLQDRVFMYDSLVAEPAAQFFFIRKLIAFFIASIVATETKIS
jgi:hypothetical protein